MSGRYVVGAVVACGVAVLAAACKEAPATPLVSAPAPALDGKYRARSLGAMREVSIRGDAYTVLRFEPCAANEGDPNACVEEGTLTTDATTVVLRERTTSRTTTFPLTIVRTKKTATLAVRPANSTLVGGGNNLLPGDQVQVFRAGDQEFQRTELVAPEQVGLTRLVPCAEVNGQCMQRSACVDYGKTHGMVGMNHLWSNDCNSSADEICCVLEEKWTPCQDLGGTCEAPGGCEFPRQFAPSGTATNCGDLLRPGTTCCIEPLTS